MEGRGKDENCPEEAEQALDLQEAKEFFTSPSQTMPTCCMRQHDDCGIMQGERAVKMEEI